MSPSTGPRPSSPRIAPFAGELSESTQAVLDATKGMGSETPFNIFSTLAHHPRALKHGVALGGGFLFAGNIPARLREIVILRVGANCGCEYEYAQHRAIGLRCDLTTADIDALAPGRSVDEVEWSAIERATITMVDELSDDDCVTDATWAVLAAEFAERELVELVMLAGYYRMLAGFLNSAGVELDEGLVGWP